MAYTPKPKQLYILTISCMPPSTNLLEYGTHTHIYLPLTRAQGTHAFASYIYTRVSSPTTNSHSKLCSPTSVTTSMNCNINCSLPQATSLLDHAHHLVIIIIVLHTGSSCIIIIIRQLTCNSQCVGSCSHLLYVI